MKLDASFDKLFREALYEQIYEWFEEVRPVIESKTKELMRTVLYESPEVSSMLSGKLRGELGFLKGQENSYIGPVIDFIVDKVNVTVVKPRNSILGFDIEYAVFDFDTLNTQAHAYYESHGGSVNWLEWITLAGNAIVVNTHIIVSTNSYNRKMSRSGLKLMRKHTGGAYSVPPEFAGTIENNWITRSIEDNIGRFLGVMEEALE